MLINTDLVETKVRAAMESKGFQEVRVSRLEYSFGSARMEIVVYGEDSGMFATEYLTGDNLDECIDQVMRMPSLEVRQINRICERLAGIEGMSEHIDDLRVRALIDPILATLNDSRKMIADMS